MRLDRLVIGVPVLIGALGVGTAYGHVIIGSGLSVRDTVYPTCAHNGVHFNKQGHANCGLHKGWSSAPPPVTPPVTPPSSGAPADAGGVGGGSKPSHPAHPTHPSQPASPSKPAHPSHPAHPGKPDTGHGATHGSSTSHGNGHASGHGDSGHTNSGDHGNSGHGK